MLYAQVAVTHKNLAVPDLVIIGIYFALVFGIGLYFARKERTSEDYFLAGRNVGWFFIGASLFVSNISTEHFIGLSGTGASSGLAVGHFEWLACLILLILGWVFVPSLLSWIASLGVMAVFLSAYDIPVSFHTLMRIAGGNSIANVTSVTPGGAGVTQAFNVASLNGIASPQDATAYSVAQQLVMTAWNLIFGIAMVVWAFGWSGGRPGFPGGSRSPAHSRWSVSMVAVVRVAASSGE